jgi:type II secretory pathway pseudopilin PulG
VTDPVVPPPEPAPPGGTPPWLKYVLIGCGAVAVLAIAVVVIAIVAAIAIPALEKSRRQARALESGGQYQEGTLVLGDRTAGDGSWYDEYPFQGQSGERIVITMESTDFDAYLQLASPSGVFSYDDDSGGGTNARMDRVLDESGTWRVWANALRPGETGDYTLTIERP